MKMYQRVDPVMLARVVKIHRRISLDQDPLNRRKMRRKRGRRSSRHLHQNGQESVVDGTA